MKDTTGSAVPRQYHAVRFYENEKSLATIVAEFLAGGLINGAPGIVVATPAQRAAIIRELIVRGIDIIPLKQSGDLVLLDAQDTLSSFMTDDKIDAQAFDDRLCGVIQKTCRGRKDCTVRIYGQMVDILWQDGKRDLAIRLEMLWNQLANTQKFSLLCGYALGPFYKDAHCNQVCAEHTHVVSSDGTANAVASPS